MRPWERRLKDLGQILLRCETAYFDPETFRINSNHFLQTARTVTFIIQKNKDSVPDFDSWYAAHVYEPWSADEVMLWARDSRNRIEKEGDIEFHSSVEARLIFSYFEEEDIPLPCGRGELLSNVKRLMRFARRQLPSGVSDAGVVKIDRRWVANTLPKWELVHAMTYIYSRTYDVCVRLAKHLGHEFGEDIPEPTTFDPLFSDARKTRYLRLSSAGFHGLSVSRMEKDPAHVPPPRLASFISEKLDQQRPATLSETVELYAGLARLTFEHFGNHVPMLFMFDENWQQVDFLTTEFEDQASKYLFWRSLADRVLYLKPSSLLWICEAWVRDSKHYPYKAIRNMPIIGETLDVIGLDRSGSYVCHRWRVHRDGATENPRLEGPEIESGTAGGKENYLVPVIKAFKNGHVDAQ